MYFMYLFYVLLVFRNVLNTLFRNAVPEPRNVPNTGAPPAVFRAA